VRHSASLRCHIVKFGRRQAIAVTIRTSASFALFREFPLRPVRRRPLPTIRSRLIRLVLGCALPILIGYVVFATDAEQRERAHVAEDAAMIAGALAAAVDRDLASSETAARTLAGGPTLAAGDLAAFQSGARRLLRPEFPAYGFELSGPDGRALVDTRHPFGTPIPPNGNEDDVRAVFASGDAVTTGVHRADASQPWLVSIAVPVWRDGRVAYALSVELRPRGLAELLAGQHLPAHWSALVFDNRGHVVAQSGAPQHAPGEPMSPPLARAVARAGVGLATLEAPGHAPMMAAYARTPAHGWTVAIGFPHLGARDLLGPDPGISLAWFAVMLAVSLLLAWRIGGTIARSVRALTGPAAALGRGEALVVPQLGIREAAVVADALAQVERELVGARTNLEARVAERTTELQRSAAMLHTVYATAPVGLAFLDHDLRVVMINDYLARLNSRPAAAHIGHALPALVGERGGEMAAAFQRVLATGRPLTDVEQSGDTPAQPGVMRYWNCSYYPVYGPDRELVGINVVVIDITQRKLEEQRNRDNEELFRALFEGSSDAHVLAAHGAGFVSANGAAVRLFGCATLDEFLTMSPASASPEFQDDGRPSSEASHANMRRALDEGAYQFEWIHRRRDGSLFHADVLLNRVDIGGRGIVHGTIRDITARVADAAALRAAGLRLAQSERLIRTVTDNLPALVGYWDAEGRCQFANRPYVEWLGRRAEDVIGHTAAVLMDEREIAELRPYIDGVRRGEPQFFERAMRPHGADPAAAGRVLHAWSSYIPDFDAAGAVRGFYMLHADITDLKRTQSRLEEALRAAEAASSAKSEFLANMSHEIRTPMNAIIGLARMLGEAPLGQRERAYVARIGMASKSLLSMLNDVLDYSKVEADRLALEQTPFQLDDVLASMVLLTANGAWDKGIEPVFAVAPGVPARLVGDPMRLEQVLLNLVSNAIKFTERGEVVLAIDVAARDDDDGRVRLAFAVRDTGIGIAPEQQHRMFEAFSQADSSTSRKYGGTGLGLAISRRLVGLMGGELDVDSAPGAGAVFHFTVPFGVAASAPPPAVIEPGLAVLVADDNAASRAALAALLVALGCRVDEAAGGAAALALLRAAAAPGGRRYDLAFLDSAMPDLDGVAVLADARADAALALPRCVLLAADPDRDRLDALAASLGVGAILAKPFTPRTLRAALAALHTGAHDGAPPAAPAAAPSMPLAGLRVLVAEDNLLNQEVAQFVLTQAGASVEFAANGERAIALLQENPGRCDAVLMDLQMPVMDGFAAAAAIRALGLLALPVIAMTANALDADRRRALAAGMNDYIAKPVDVDELVAKLRRLVGRAPLADVPGAALAGPEALHLPGIDVAAALARFDGRYDAFAALLKRFAASHRNAVTEIRALLDAGTLDAAAQAAHRLGGIAANLGATDVARHALALQNALRPAPAPAPGPLLNALDAALRIVLAAADTLDEPAAPQCPPDETGSTAVHASRAALAHLLDLLQNNNMKALAYFASLRTDLALIAPARLAPLTDAVTTLRFDAAAQLVREVLAATGAA
jgi:two-component system sensor histidine kinase/response regulator